MWDKPERTRSRGGALAASPASQAPLQLRPGMQQSAKGSLSSTLADPDRAPRQPGSGHCCDRAKSRREGRSQRRRAKSCSPWQRTGSEGCRVQHTMLADKPSSSSLGAEFTLNLCTHVCFAHTRIYIYTYILITYTYIYIHTHTTHPSLSPQAPARPSSWRGAW